MAHIQGVEELDDLIRRGIVPDDGASRDMRKFLASPSVAEFDDLVRRRIIPDNDAARDARRILASWEYFAANPPVVHVPKKAEDAYQGFLDECKARGIAPTVIKMNVIEGIITIGGNGEILSIAKGGNPPVTVPAIDTSVRN